MRWAARLNCWLNCLIGTATMPEFWASLFSPPLVLMSGHEQGKIDEGEHGSIWECSLCGRIEYWRRPT